MRLVQLPSFVLAAILTAGVLSASVTAHLTVSKQVPALATHIHWAGLADPGPPANRSTRA